MTLLARLDESWHGDVAVVAVDGEIDASNTAQIGRHVRRLMPNRGAGLVLDLAATSYLDSAGINLVFDLAAELAQRQQQLHIVVERHSSIARMIAITGLDQTVPCHATADVAVAALAGERS